LAKRKLWYSYRTPEHTLTQKKKLWEKTNLKKNLGPKTLKKI
jgi:hypothetical protein